MLCLEVSRLARDNCDWAQLVQFAPNWSLRFKQFVIVKNEQIIYTSHPNQEEYAFEFRDRGFTAGSNYYYIRVVQNDGQVAWSSPIWVG